MELNVSVPIKCVIIKIQYLFMCKKLIFDIKDGIERILNVLYNGTKKFFPF